MDNAVLNLNYPNEVDAQQTSIWRRDARRLGTYGYQGTAQLDLDTFSSVREKGTDLAQMARSGGSRSLDGGIFS